MTAWYNEIDPYAAQWLRNLIGAGQIAQGDVDERSIVDVAPEDLDGYDQCHFFAGIGGWSLALRLAGWPDGRPVWTGSCPCQPLSGAGQRKGHADERHLWPAFHRLIAERRPATVLGEQVAGKDGREWLAAVRADLEADGYACGSTDLCAAGVGAPHIRQRLYWVADAASGRREPRQGQRGIQGAQAGSDAVSQPGAGRASGRMADAEDAGSQGYRRQSGELDVPQGWQAPAGRAGPGGAAGGLADAESRHPRRSFDECGGSGQGSHPQGIEQQYRGSGADGGLADADQSRRSIERTTRSGDRRETTHRNDADGRSKDQQRPCPADGFWGNADWLWCRDGRWRPVEPGAFPLADGVPARVGRLRAYGNAIVPQVAAAFVRAFMEALA